LTLERQFPDEVTVSNEGLTENARPTIKQIIAAYETDDNHDRLKTELRQAKKLLTAKDGDTPAALFDPLRFRNLLKSTQSRPTARVCRSQPNHLGRDRFKTQGLQ